LRPHLEEARRKGANVAIIGNGLPAMAKAFARRMELGADTLLLTDPRRESYRLAGFRRGLWATLGPRALLKLLPALRRFGARRIQGDRPRPLDVVAALG